MQLSQNAFRTDLVFAAILLAALLSVSLFALVAAAERLVIPWYSASRGAR
jgi:ABC-type nitrate/sulfonate/bicarbonate transport system permease component